MWRGWIMMRGDDGAIDDILSNPKRRSRLHWFPSASDRLAVCGVKSPTEDNHLGDVREGEGKKCTRCAKRVAWAPEPLDLVRELRQAVGLFDGAMPITPKRAWDEAIDRARQLAAGRLSGGTPTNG